MEENSTKLFRISTIPPSLRVFINQPKETKRNQHSFKTTTSLSFINGIRDAWSTADWISIHRPNVSTHFLINCINTFSKCVDTFLINCINTFSKCVDTFYKYVDDTFPRYLCINTMDIFMARNETDFSSKNLQNREEKEKWKHNSTARERKIWVISSWDFLEIETLVNDRFNVSAGQDVIV